MKIKALVPFSNGIISMEQYQVAEVTDTLGNQLIAAGVAIEIGGGGTGGGVLVVNAVFDDGTNTVTLDKTWQEIQDADFAVVKADFEGTGAVMPCTGIYHRNAIPPLQEVWGVEALEYLGDSVQKIIFKADSASGYPSYTME